MITPAEFAARHRPGTPLLLPNAWDVASAYRLVALGYDAIATTSLGVAVANGLHDGAGEAATETMRLAERLTAAGIGVTVDIESGFSDDPDEVARFVRRLSELGVLGVNLEDADATGALIDPELAAAKVAAVVAAAPELYVNARTDVFWLGAGDSEADRESSAIARAKRYVAAGASGVFVPGTMPIEVIARIAGEVVAPLNVLPQPGVPFAGLAAAGVARVSTGSALFRAALGAIEDALGSMFDSGARTGTIPSYAETAALVDLDVDAAHGSEQADANSALAHDHGDAIPLG
ncbi:2-Methylisocitrate lyase, PEP mutase family [Agromyces sp. CF514]|uniref:isocitrate lyase/PEP mutase family protein n=1 Tax=Agromyces sp. CF514 TaxID=1881031 RepID=UPI0008DEE92A|nr:isocitrate lyase/phosphoenolpyruvate mutase family protein [Agromyces sp. CF514]SFR79292.1 2-Methylisocitrate lyase, PEP mutase family [Agromyces sp. CF514]